MNRDRFKDAPWVVDADIVVGGAGGIGSWLTLFLSRIGYAVYLYDNDMFEEHNMGGQFVSTSDIGLNKSRVMSRLVRNFGGKPISNYSESYTKDGICSMYMIAAFDNMEARKIMFNNWFDYNSKKMNSDALFIDGRLTMEQLQIICVTPTTTKLYRENHLFSDSEVDDAPCTMKQTSHSAAMIASIMTGFLTNHITNVVEKNKARAVPFEFEYFIPLNLYSNVI